MTAYIARISFNTVAPDGVTPTTVPIGARVEKGDHWYNAYPDAFVPEGETQQFFGRVNPANGAVETTTSAAPPEVKTEAAPPAPENPAPVTEPAPAPKTTAGPRSSAGRKLPSK